MFRVAAVEWPWERNHHLQPATSGGTQGTRAARNLRQRFWMCKGKFVVPADSDAPFPNALLDLFEGRTKRSKAKTWRIRSSQSFHKRKPPRKALALLPRRAPSGTVLSFLALPP